MIVNYHGLGSRQIIAKIDEYTRYVTVKTLTISWRLCYMFGVKVNENLDKKGLNWYEKQVNQHSCAEFPPYSGRQLIGCESLIGCEPLRDRVINLILGGIQVFNQFIH